MSEDTEIDGILICMPVEKTKVRAKGSQVIQCEECSCDIFIAPSSLPLRAKRVCIDCAINALDDDDSRKQLVKALKDGIENNGDTKH